MISDRCRPTNLGAQKLLACLRAPIALRQQQSFAVPAMHHAKQAYNNPLKYKDS
jgi:hypothetical protein